jgi:hypothetical protein
MTWNNSDHGYLYGSVGSCHTPEEAHRVLFERHLQPLKMAIRECEHIRKEREVDRAILQRKIDKCEDELDRAKLKLELEKIGIHIVVEDESYAYALHEVQFVEALIARIDPHCMWHNVEGMSVQTGYQLAQQEERRLLLLERAQIGLMSHGNVDSETFREILVHPQAPEIMGQIQHMRLTGKDSGILLTPNKVIMLLLPEHSGDKALL